MSHSPQLSLTKASAEEGPVIIAVVQTESTDRITHAHSHARGQLIGSTRGLLSIEAGNSHWVVPATHAVWIPSNLSHALVSHGPFTGWSLYVSPAACRCLPIKPITYIVPGLLKEAIFRAATWNTEKLDPTQQRISEVILDEIRALKHETSGLPMPGDSRLLKIAKALSDNPSDGRSLIDWSTFAGVATRTLTRRFLKETGLNFSEWRQRIRLLRSLELLATGASVKFVAISLGYENVSSFITLFRSFFGMTPGQYLKSEASPDSLQFPNPLNRRTP